MVHNVTHTYKSTTNNIYSSFVCVCTEGTRIKLEPKHLRPIDLTPRWHNYRNDHNHVEQAPVRQQSNAVPSEAYFSDWADFVTLCASCIEVSGAVVAEQGSNTAGNDDDVDHGNGAASTIISLSAEFFPGLDTLTIDDTTVVPSPPQRLSPRGSPSLSRLEHPPPQPSKQPRLLTPLKQQEQQQQQQRPASMQDPDAVEQEGTVEIVQPKPAQAMVMQLVKNGNTALHWAAWKNHTTLLRQLLSNGSPPRQPNRVGQTALHWAAKRGSIQASKILLGHGGSLLNVRDSLGKNAEDVARERGFPELAKLLQNAAASQQAAIANAHANGISSSDAVAAMEAKAFDVMLYEETLEGGLGAYDDGSAGGGGGGGGGGGASSDLATELGYERVRSLTIRRAEGEKLGLRLQASKEHAGTLACKIADGGAAQRAGVIKDGDLIIAIQFKSVFELTHKELIATIGQAGPSLEMNVVTPAEDDFKFLALEEASGFPPFQAGGGSNGLQGLAAPGLLAQQQQSPTPVSPPPLQQQHQQQHSAEVNRPTSAGSPKQQQQQQQQQQPPPPKRSNSASTGGAKLVNLSDPDLETSTTVQYKIPDMEFTDTKSLRITLPSWACTRVLRHVRVLHRKGPEGWGGFVATGDGEVQDIQPTYQSVRAWGFCLSTNGGTQYLVPGATAMLHAFNQCELDGHLVTVLQVMDKGRFDVQLKISGKRLVTTLDHLRGIQGDAQYYEYNGAKSERSEEHIDGVGVAVPYVDSDTPVQTSFEDWNASIGVLHAGAIEVVTSNGVAVVSGVEIEFFPAHVPAYAGGVQISVDEQIYSTGTQFIPLLSGLPGLVEQARFGNVHFNLLDEDRPATAAAGGAGAGGTHGTPTPWCIGSGWTSNGSRLVLAHERREGLWRVDPDGVFRIPLKDGLRVLSIEVAVRDYTGAGASADVRTRQSTGTVWCKFSRQRRGGGGGDDDDFVFRRNDVCGNAVLSGGPATNDHVAVEGDELLVGTDVAPAWLLGYRITYCASDPAIKDINLLRHTKEQEQRDVELMATKLLHARTKDGLMVEARMVRAPDAVQDALGAGTFGAVLKAQTCLGKMYALKPFKPAAGLVPTAANDLFECAAKLASYTNNDNVASIRGLCTASDYADDPLETIPYLMLELFPLRSLRDALNKEGLPLEMQLEIMCGVCSGMYHLHTHALLPICHGDLKASNVMLRNDFTPCISDFGLARFKLPGGPAAARTGVAAVLPACVAGSIPWMAPELLAGSTFTPTPATDVYAFAMLMYEMMTRKTPWHELDSDHLVAEKVMGGLRPAVPAGNEVEQLMQQRQEDCCCHDRLQRRVSFLGIRMWLEQIHKIAEEEEVVAVEEEEEAAAAAEVAEEVARRSADGAAESQPWKWPVAATSDESSWVRHCQRSGGEGGEGEGGLLFCDTGSASDREAAAAGAAAAGADGGGNAADGRRTTAAALREHALAVMSSEPNGSSGRSALFDLSHIIALRNTKAESLFGFLLRAGKAWISRDHKDWQSESNFVRCGEDVFSSPSVSKSRSMASDSDDSSISVLVKLEDTDGGPQIP